MWQNSTLKGFERGSHMKKAYEIPRNLRYTPTHEWVKILDGKIAIIGITSYAEDRMRGILSIELPSLGKQIKKNESIAIVETAKAVIEVFSPLSGEILEANQKLIEEPLILGMDPYVKGWIAKLEISDLKETLELINCENYKEYINRIPPSVRSSDGYY